MLKEPCLTTLEEQILVYISATPTVAFTVDNIAAIFDIHLEHVEAAMKNLKKHGYLR